MNNEGGKFNAKDGKGVVKLKGREKRGSEEL